MPYLPFFILILNLIQSWELNKKMSDEILELRLKEKDDKLQKENEEMETEKSQVNYMKFLGIISKFYLGK